MFKPRQEKAITSVGEYKVDRSKRHIRFNYTEMIKSMAWIIMQVAVTPNIMIYHALKMLIGKYHAFVYTSHHIAQWPGMFGIYGRRAVYKRLVCKIGDEVSINFGTILTKSTTQLDDFVYIGTQCVIGDVNIGRKTLIGDRVCILSGSSQHSISRLDIPIADQPESYRKIYIGEDCWIGSGAIIMADIRNHCVVGAGSVVTKTVSDYQIVVGNPARSIADRRDMVK